MSAFRGKIRLGPAAQVVVGSCNNPQYTGVTEGEPLSESQPTVRRERTAIRRTVLSASVAGPGERSDYQGDVGSRLRVWARGRCPISASKKIRARGWDPHYAPDRRGLQPADVVNLGYVLNVIEKPDERTQALHSAFGLAQKALVVAVRVDRALAGTDAEEFGDGVLTARDTFQKVFTQEEFCSYLETVCWPSAARHLAAAWPMSSRTRALSSTTLRHVRLRAISVPDRAAC